MFKAKTDESEDSADSGEESIGGSAPNPERVVSKETRETAADFGIPENMDIGRDREAEDPEVE